MIIERTPYDKPYHPTKMTTLGLQKSELSIRYMVEFIGLNIFVVCNSGIFCGIKSAYDDLFLVYGDSRSESFPVLSNATVSCSAYWHFHILRLGASVDPSAVYRIVSIIWIDSIDGKVVFVAIYERPFEKCSKRLIPKVKYFYSFSVPILGSVIGISAPVSHIHPDSVDSWIFVFEGTIERHNATPGCEMQAGSASWLIRVPVPEGRSCNNYTEKRLCA